jgi:hypothetical protein
LLFAITGALLGYYLKELKGQPSAKWILFPAIVVSVIFGIGFFVAGCLVGPRKEEVARIAKRFDFSSPPNMTLLQVVVWLMSLVNIVMALGLAALLAM